MASAHVGKLDDYDSMVPTSLDNNDIKHISW